MSIYQSLCRVYILPAAQLLQFYFPRREAVDIRRRCRRSVRQYNCPLFGPQGENQLGYRMRMYAQIYILMGAIREGNFMLQENCATC